MELAAARACRRDAAPCLQDTEDRRGQKQAAIPELLHSAPQLGPVLEPVIVPHLGHAPEVDMAGIPLWRHCRDLMAAD